MSSPVLVVINRHLKTKLNRRNLRTLTVLMFISVNNHHMTHKLIKKKIVQIVGRTYVVSKNFG